MASPTDAMMSRLSQALLLLPDSPNRELLREALYATASARDTPQLQLRLSLLAALVVDNFRSTPAVVVALLQDIELAMSERAEEHAAFAF